MPKRKTSSTARSKRRSALRIALIPAAGTQRAPNPVPVGRWLRITGMKIGRDGRISVRRPRKNA